ncbi:hypothetical protein B0J18DRAFT_114188 [Chaetomium sp. MPI-SDFR-AT-0129]|nr:hypothetical protein B0J18DRAFT_114188 [Chaetomium sp. MPI-SDFR-AT-0129]
MPRDAPLAQPLLLPFSLLSSPLLSSPLLFSTTLSISSPTRLVSRPPLGMRQVANYAIVRACGQDGPWDSEGAGCLSIHNVLCCPRAVLPR